MTANLPVAVGDEVDADLLNEISGISESKSYQLAASAAPLTSTANTDTSILTGSFDFVSGYAYEITMTCRYQMVCTPVAASEGRCLFGLRRTNAAGTSFFASGYVSVSESAVPFQFHSAQMVKCTAGDTTQTISWNAQFSTSTTATSLTILVNGSISPARMTIRRVGLAANHPDAVEIPTA